MYLSLSVYKQRYFLHFPGDILISYHLNVPSSVIVCSIGVTSVISITGTDGSEDGFVDDDSCIKGFLSLSKLLSFC